MWSPLPVLPRGVFWPVAVTFEEENSIWPVVRAYEAYGFALCADGALVAGVEKLAIYVVGEKEADYEPTHVAVQRASGVWQSKLGDEIDAEHSLESLESGELGVSIYGKARVFMQRDRMAPGG